MKILALAAAAAMITGAAYAQKAPVEQKGNLDASTETQIEQGEGATQKERTGWRLPMIDFGSTASVDNSSGMSNDDKVDSSEFRNPGNLDASTRDNLSGR